MFLNTKIFLCVLFISTITFAQQTEDNVEPETSQKQTGRKIGSITFGPYMPISFGDNFVNNGMDLKIGAQFQMKLNVLKDFYVGPAFSFFSGKVNNTALVGNYKGTTNFTIGAVVGYEKQVERFDLSIGVGVGHSGYYNRGLGDNFEDRGTAVWLRPEVSYRLANYISIYVAPDLRHDFMSINVPKELDDSFGGVNYFNLGLGLRFNLGTGYKFQ